MRKNFLSLIICLLILGLISGCGKPSDNSTIKLNWSNLNISLGDNNYQYPLKPIDFINNDWIASSANDEQTLNKIISSNDNYNFIVLKNDGLLMQMFVDNKVPNISVKDSNIVSLSIEKETSDPSTSFEVDEFKLGSIATQSDIESKFGTENYEILSDENNYTYHYYKTLNNLKVELEIITNIKTNEITKISLSGN